MNEQVAQPAAVPPPAPADAPRHAPSAALVDAETVDRELAADNRLRWMLVLVLPLLIVMFAEVVFSHATASGVLIFLIAIAWFAVNFISAQTWQRVTMLGRMMDEDQNAFEGNLLGALRRKPLHRTVRLMLYHRLAVLRHRQQRFIETACVCRAVLAQTRMGGAVQVRPHLLLMMVESLLAMGDLWGAHAGLVELSRMKLSLVESLQCMGLRTRYMVAAGLDDAAMADLSRTVDMAELMPAAQCGVTHALLSIAAARAGHNDIADWLRRRAELICEPEQLEHLARTVGFVDAPVEIVPPTT